jgi:cytochrome c
MRAIKRNDARPGLAAAAGLLLLCGAAHAAPYGIGTPASPAQIAGWNIDIAPDGKNLPAGEGTIAAGKAIYETQCASCHGARGEGGIGDRLAGGMGTLADQKPIKTVGSFWPYATTLYDYIRRAMPLTAPQSLSNDELYAVTGYVLSLNGLWPGDQKVDATTLMGIRMPNRDGFVSDPRPDVR